MLSAKALSSSISSSLSSGSLKAAFFNAFNLQCLLILLIVDFLMRLISISYLLMNFPTSSNKMWYLISHRSPLYQFIFNCSIASS